MRRSHVLCSKIARHVTSVGHNSACSPAHKWTVTGLAGSRPFRAQTSLTATRRFSTISRRSGQGLVVRRGSDHVTFENASNEEHRDQHHKLRQLKLSTSSASHHDLDTFLQHARRTSLSRESTTYRGTFYEYLTQLTLKRYGFDLVRVGGRGDGGVDMVGLWCLTNGSTETDTVQGPSQRGIRVLVQCKRLQGTSKLGPNLIREMEGAIRASNIPAGWRGKGTMGLLVGTRPATKGVRDAMAAFRTAVGWVYLATDEMEKRDSNEHDPSPEALADTSVHHAYLGRVKQMLWNKAASDLGLAGIDVVARYAPAVGGTEPTPQQKEVVLMRQGRVISGSYLTTNRSSVIDNGPDARPDQLFLPNA